jgi:tRNA-2-methylthio-N6-dimethylallyladenosine synthase
MTTGQKRVFIKTYGCQMNAYDSERIADVLAPHGYAPAETAEGADLVVLNTCHIREKAAEKLYSDLGRLRPLKADKAASGGQMLVAVAGCVAQAEGAEITARTPVADLVVGPQSYHRLPELIARAEQGSRPSKEVQTEFEVADKFRKLGPRRASGPAAFLTVQEGCDKFCSFCVVPYTRGAEFSRAPAQILDEARALADQGVREITLLGQNVNAWTAEGWSFGRLLRDLARIPGVVRLRYTTSHPRDMDDDLIAAHADLPELMPYLHLPLQSGSDRILKAMNRRHTLADYLRMVERIRAARADIAMSGDFIVGFPGETDADFEGTLSAVRAVDYAAAYSFKYSRRPGTPASDSGDQVPEDVKTDRLAQLQALLASQTGAFNASKLGTTMPVLFEKPGRRPGQLSGRSPWLQPIHVDVGHMDAPEALLGQMVDVEIVAATQTSLTGRLAKTQDRAA